eukprot:scaffold106434_cov19-Prasinocladus_malaysianus.AAC.1
MTATQIAPTQRSLGIHHVMCQERLRRAELASALHQRPWICASTTSRASSCQRGIEWTGEELEVC